jgi:acyl carrier protein
MSSVEMIVRERLCKTLKRPPDQLAFLNLSEDLVYGYGLASLDLIMLMTAVCSDAGVALTEFTEEDISRLRTASDIVKLLASKTPA